MRLIDVSSGPPDVEPPLGFEELVGFFVPVGSVLGMSGMSMSGTSSFGMEKVGTGGANDLFLSSSPQPVSIAMATTPEAATAVTRITDLRGERKERIGGRKPLVVGWTTRVWCRHLPHVRGVNP